MAEVGTYCRYSYKDLEGFSINDLIDKDIRFTIGSDGEEDKYNAGDDKESEP